MKNCFRFSTVAMQIHCHLLLYDLACKMKDTSTYDYDMWVINERYENGLETVKCNFSDQAPDVNSLKFSYYSEYIESGQRSRYNRNIKINVISKCHIIT
jgi:hypothetical protein